MNHAPKIGRSLARAAIRAYQLTLSSLVGSQCRHLPTCSAYMGLARVCRCQPLGTAGFDPVPRELPPDADWLRPWRYGLWRGPLPDLAAPESGETGESPEACAAVSAADQPDAARQA